MKWFIKALSQYADFSGRARRKEYWMFALFNMIFIFAWTILFMVVLFITHSGIYETFLTATYATYLCYCIILFLPSLAVSVRRLHDVGKSGWWLFINLIPFIGAIWLLILMLTDGQPGENKYGANPKTSPEIFSDKSKLKSAGVTLIVTFLLVILLTIIFSWILPIIYNEYSFVSHTPFLIRRIFYFVAIVILLITGFKLFNEKSITEILEKKKNTITLLLTAAFIFVLLDIWSLPVIIKAPFSIFIFDYIIVVLSNLSVALFAASILFSAQNKDSIRKTALTTVIIMSICLLWKVYFYMKTYSMGTPEFIYLQLQNLFAVFYILMPVAFIVLAGTFLSKEQEQVRNINISPYKPYKPENNDFNGSVYESVKKDIIPKEKPENIQTKISFPQYTGSGVCDVCNSPLNDTTAYIVPNKVFYNSHKYRNYVKNSVMTSLMGIPINDAYFAQMQARDTSAGSAVCKNCIYMFE